MTRLAPIDLTRLPAPQAIQPLDFEGILAAIKAELTAILPEVAAVLDLESEPMVKLLEVWAYREILLRGAGNDLARARFIALASGSDLDHLAANYGVARLVISPAQPNAVPPIAAVYEADEALRYRTQLSIEAMSNAGTLASYEYFARTADGRVRDVAVLQNIDAGTVRFVVLSHDDDGVADADLLNAVTMAVGKPTVRSLNDTIVVQAATMADFTIEAQVVVSTAPGVTEVMAAANAAIAAYLDRSFRVGQIVRRTALLAALHQEGVETVTLTSPAADVDPGAMGAARCVSITIDHEVPA